MQSRVMVAALALAGVTACAGNPQPGDPDYPYNINGEYQAEFVADDGSLYTGTITLATSMGGMVSGQMALTDPLGVDGSIEGALVPDEDGNYTMVDITVTYTIPDVNCGGVGVGSGIIEEGGGAVAGTMEIQDDCQGPISTTFTLTLP